MFLNEGVMKKVFLFFFCFAVFTVNSVAVSAANAPVADGSGFAPAAPPMGGGFTGGGAVGGFAGPGPVITPASSVATLRDDTPVVLRGHIVQHLGGEKYIFRDASGTVRVDIDHDKWPPQPITPNNIVELHGEVDRDWRHVEVDVERIIIRQ